MINKIIANYLAGGKRLVIPQFGAFIHKEGDGTVVFVPFLKKDDGVLVDLLRREYGLDEADARGVITEYVAQIGSGIAERGSFAIEGIGSLKMDANGICFLEYNPQTGVSSASSTAQTPSEVKANATVADAAVPASAAPVASNPATGSASLGTSSSTSAPAANPQRSGATRDVVREAYYGSASTPRSGAVPRPGAASEPPVSSGPVVASGSAPSSGTVRPGTSQGSMTTPGTTRPGSPSPTTPSGMNRPGNSSPAAPAGMNRPVQQRPVQTAPPSYPQRPEKEGSDRGEARQGIRPGMSGQPARSAQPAPATSVPPRAAGNSPYGTPARPAWGGSSGEGGEQPPVGGNGRVYGGGRPPGDRPPGRPVPPRPARVKPAKSDKFMVIAILAAIVALASIIYGVMSSSDGPMIEPMEMPARHTPDSLSAGADTIPTATASDIQTQTR